MTITPNQLRSARAFLDMSRNHVAEQTSIGVQTLADLENGKTASPRISTLNTLKLFYEVNGLEFAEDGGIRPRKALIRQYEGTDGFKSFMDDVYEVVKAEGGEVCLHNAKPENWLKWLGKEWNAFHTNRMLEIEKPMDFKITSASNDYNMVGKHAEYRWLPEDMWNEQSFYAYGDRIALLNFEEDNVHIVVMYNREFANGFRALFNVTWQHSTIKPDHKNG